MTQPSAGPVGGDDLRERSELTDLLYDLDWDLSQVGDAQDYLQRRLIALGGPIDEEDLDA